MEVKVQKTKLLRISRKVTAVQIMTDGKQQENVEYFVYLGSMMTNDVRYTGQIKYRTVIATAAFDT